MTSKRHLSRRASAVRRRGGRLGRLGILVRTPGTEAQGRRKPAPTPDAINGNFGAFETAAWPARSAILAG